MSFKTMLLAAVVTIATVNVANLPTTVSSVVPNLLAPQADSSKDQGSGTCHWIQRALGWCSKH